MLLGHQVHKKMPGASPGPMLRYALSALVNEPVAPGFRKPAVALWYGQFEAFQNLSEALPII
jgi:hypothetical protein